MGISCCFVRLKKAVGIASLLASLPCLVPGELFDVVVVEGKLNTLREPFAFT